MEKPNRQEFTREFGARAAAKYATAMRDYRKFLKKQPKPNPKAASEAARIATAMKREVGTRQSQKVTNAMKRNVNTRKSQRVTDSMKRDANKPKSARASTKQQEKPTSNSNAQFAARRTASAMRSSVNKRKSQEVTDAMMRDAKKPKSAPKSTKKSQSSGSGGRKNAKVVKQNQNPAVRKFLKNLADQFKTFGTYKEDQAVNVGNIDFISDGKGGVRGARRRQF